MAITRGQMQRELYGIGSYFPPENGRSKFGLGSKLKRFVRKIIPNEVAEVAVKAAPFVAPFNPLLAGGMSALGTFDQTGRIGQSVKAGLINYGLGQAGRYIGGAGFQEGINPFAGYSSSGSFGGLGSLFSSPIGTETGLQLGQYEIFGGPGRETFQAQQELGKTIQADAAQKAAAQNLDSYAGIEEYLAKTDPSQLTLSQRADLVAADLASKPQTTGYKELFSKVVSPDATLAERTTAIKDLGGKALKAAFTKPVPGSPGETQIDKLAVGATIAGTVSYIEAKKLAEEAELVDDADEYTEEMYNADKDRYLKYYSKALPASAFGIKAADGGLISLREKKSDGTTEEDLVYMTDDNSGVIYRDPEGKPITKEEFFRRTSEAEQESNNILPKAKPKEIVFKGRLERLMEAKDMLAPESFEYLLNELKEEMAGSGIPSIKLKEKDDATFMQEGYNLEKKATGGRVGLKNGSNKSDIFSIGSPETVEKVGKKLNKGITSLGEIILDDEGSVYLPIQYLRKFGEDIFFGGQKNPNLPEAMYDKLSDEYIEEMKKVKERGYKKGGRIQYAMGSEVPLRQNQAGVTEMDFRNTGGFVPPIGVKEKADDIPAMLSNNEFVFTADAVRAAGGGSVNKGAQKMYALMKQLEGKMV